MAKEKLLTLAGLQSYNTKVDAREDAKDAKILEQANKYADGLAENYDAAGTAETKVKELADGAVADNTEAIAKLNGDAETEGSVAKAVADAKKAVEGSLATTQEDLDTLEEKVAGMYTNEQIDTAITNVDTKLQKAIDVNAEAIEAHKTAVDDKVTTLVGEDTGKSVRTIANEELAAQLIGENAKESLDTLEEIAAWIQNHPDDASAMNKAIEDLTALVGVLPESVTATTIAGYVAEVIAAEKERAEGVESGLDTRLQAVESAIGEGGSVDSQIDAKIAELDADITSATVEEGKGIQVQVVEVDGKLTSVVVTGNYNNAYDAKGAAETAEANAKAEVTALANGAVKTNTEAIAAINNETNGILAQAKAHADAKDEAMDARVDVVEAAIGENGVVTNAIADAKQAGLDAVNALEEGQVTTNANAISALEEKVGEGYEVISEEEIAAMFTQA